MIQFDLLPSSLSFGQPLAQVRHFRPAGWGMFEAVLSQGNGGTENRK